MNKQKILIILSLIILIVLFVTALFSYQNKNSPSTPIRDILSLTSPVMELQGTIYSIEGSVLTISYIDKDTLQQPTPGTKTMKFLITKKTNISYGTGYLDLPVISEQQTPPKYPVLKKGQTVNIMTETDIRKVQTTPPHITHIRIISVSRGLVGKIINQINTNTLSVRGRPVMEPIMFKSNPKEEDYLINVMADTKLINTHLLPSSENSSFDNLVPGTSVVVYTAEDIVETKQGKALAIMIHAPPLELPRTTPTSVDVSPQPE